MRISFERSGGFAGIPLRFQVSADSLPDDERRKVTELLESAHFFELPAVIARSGPGADMFQFKIAVESDQRTHEVQVDEGAVPAQLQPLLSWLVAAARKR